MGSSERGTASRFGGLLKDSAAEPRLRTLAVRAGAGPAMQKSQTAGLCRAGDQGRPYFLG